MPLAVEPADWPVRLGEAEADPRMLLRPAGNDVLRLWPVSLRVNTPRNNDADLIEPIEVLD